MSPLWSAAIEWHRLSSRGESRQWRAVATQARARVERRPRALVAGFNRHVGGVEHGRHFGELKPRTDVLCP